MEPNATYLQRNNYAETQPKEKIVDAALKCFTTRGFGNTRIREIAEAAQVSEAALYRHFESKEAIAQSLFNQHFQQFGQRMKNTFASA